VGVEHPLVTGAQAAGYRAFAKTGQQLTWEAVAQIETNALIKAGMKAPGLAARTVSQAMESLKAAGVAGRPKSLGEDDMRPELEEFARLLVAHVRDRAIQMADVSVRPESAGPIATSWRNAGVRRADVVIPDVVDTTIFALLSAIDQGLLPVAFHSAEGTSLDLVEQGQGELGGWYMTSDGWRASHSKERFVDHLAEPES